MFFSAGERSLILKVMFHPITPKYQKCPLSSRIEKKTTASRKQRCARLGWLRATAEVETALKRLLPNNAQVHDHLNLESPASNLSDTYHTNQ